MIDEFLALLTNFDEKSYLYAITHVCVMRQVHNTHGLFEQQNIL